jgi:hypothetical protein
MTESRRIRWARHVAHMGEKMNAYRVLVGSQTERNHKENLDISGRILRWILEDWIDLAQKRNQWRVLLNTVINLRVP